MQNHTTDSTTASTNPYQDTSNNDDSPDKEEHDNLIEEEKTPIENEDDALAKLIEETPLENMKTLYSHLKEGPVAENCARLKRVLDKYADCKFWGMYYIDVQNKGKSLGYDYLSKQFENYIKVLNCLYTLGETSVLNLFYTIHLEAGRLGTESYTDDFETLLDEEGYIFHTRNHTLVSKEMRDYLAGEYKKGKAPFKKNAAEHQKYKQTLDLPLQVERFKWTQNGQAYVGTPIK